MELIRFKGDSKIYTGTLSYLGEHVLSLSLTSALPGKNVYTAGFELVNEHNGIVQGDYSSYTTVYREYPGKNVVELSDDGRLYVEPAPQPEPEPYVPTLQEVQEKKVRELNDAQQATIAAGVGITLTDGTKEWFTLTSNDQISLMALQSEVASGAEQIPWHTSDQLQGCKYYSNADMKLIISGSMAYVTWHVTYFRDLRIFVRSLQTKSLVEAVTYGMKIPEEYQSEPLKAMIAQRELQKAEKEKQKQGQSKAPLES